MAKSDFQEYLCRPYCVFFKEGQKEAMSCRGARIVEHLLNKKSVDLRAMPPLQKRSDLWERLREPLGVPVCRPCAFFAEDCDFQAAERRDDAEPCGGFILLAHLYEEGLVPLTDME